MLSNSVRQFLNDERGSYTVWSLVWFILYVCVGGLAVDMTDAYRNQSLLQSTADAAALAGVMSLPDEDEVIYAATGYAAANMTPEVHGTVLKDTEVFTGTWNFDGASFTGGTADPNAVYVITRRAGENQNPVAMNFLRILGLFGLDPLWDVSTEAVAARYYPDCLKNGFVAGGRVWFNNNNDFYNNICIHGQVDGVGHQGAVSGNSYESGVSISRGHPDGLLFNDQALQEDDLSEAVERGGVGELWPAEAYEAGSYIDMLAQLPDITYDEFTTAAAYDKYEGWEWMYPEVDGVREAPLSSTQQPADDVYEEYTVYDFSGCSGQIQIGSGVVLSNVVIIADCRIHVAADMSAGNVVLASRFTGPQAAISIAAQALLGDPGYCNTGTGGVEIYTLGDAHLAAQTDWHGVRVAAAGDVGLAAQNDVYGVSVQAGGDIDFQSNGRYGLCPNELEEGPIEWRYRLVH